MVGSVTRGAHCKANHRPRVLPAWRSSSPMAMPTPFHVIGLGDDTSINKSFLKTIANDKDTIPGSTYDPSQPAGTAVFASSADDFKAVFQTIASKILIRLTR